MLRRRLDRHDAIDDHARLGPAAVGIADEEHAPVHLQGVAVLRAGDGADHGFDFFSGNGADAQDCWGTLRWHGDDRRFNTDKARPAIENEIDFVAEFFRGVLGHGRADMAGDIRARRREREGQRHQQAARGFMRGRAQRDRIEAGAGEVAHAGAGQTRRDDC